uniref:Uncharacterized protein n=1 Tax=Castor canadensis TaxID=51338 RepID=A0A8C0W905_CASCN
MASDIHDCKKWNLKNNIEDHCTDLSRKRNGNFTNKNMKEIQKSPRPFIIFILFIYSHVCTLFGSFSSPPAPCSTLSSLPLASRQNLFCPFLLLIC